jgi:hypothetical protein
MDFYGVLLQFEKRIGMNMQKIKALLNFKVHLLQRCFSLPLLSSLKKRNAFLSLITHEQAVFVGSGRGSGSEGGDTRKRFYRSFLKFFRLMKKLLSRIESDFIHLHLYMHTQVHRWVK